MAEDVDSPLAAVADAVAAGRSTTEPSIPAPQDAGLALVAREHDFGDRYRVWRGRSGRRYLVTVMPLGEAMRIDGAIVLLVAVEGDGGRRIVWAGETGCGLPALHLNPEDRLEAHVHLIAADQDVRIAALSDLASGTQCYSSVLTVRAAASHDKVGSTTPSRSSSRTVFTT
jgi:hypothetical protein